MKSAAVFVFLAFCAISAMSLADDKDKFIPPVSVEPAGEFSQSPTKEPKTTKPQTTKPPTTKPPTTKPPTTKPPTTKPPTTKPPTTKPPTTKPPTTKPPTTKPPTTKPPTTKPPTTKPPTTKPPTTTPKPTTTPPKPTPSTNLTVGNYTLMGEKNVICLMAQMALQIRLVIPKDNGTFIVQPKATKAEGGCKDPKANLTLVFPEGFITFMFNKSAADDTVYVNSLSFSLVYPLSKTENKFNGFNSSVKLFTAKVGHSYSCKSESLYMGKGLYLDVTQDRMQAFNLTKSNEFGLPDPCPADQPDYRVAVAVGVTLLVLIVIVVLAYLLGRRRRTDGYQTL
ncbi:macrosialin-like [Notolabrus celidotus]|uniref:macrosialin-like n=1 Tax=Notolabrus celidotus TaxID=1203425 RepID=UPI0014902788|nr:macrosialin-like [Notolabrus celidotus]